MADDRSLMALPNLDAVLIMLPLHSLLVCCAVSNSLLNLIRNDPGFARIHFAKSESQLMISSFWTLAFHLIDLNTVTCTELGERVEVKPTFNHPLRHFHVRDSCNGFALLTYTTMTADDCVHRCCVSNPVRGEYTMIPETTHLYRNVTCAFFYCPRANQFKILRAFHRVHHLDSDDSSDHSESDSELGFKLDSSADSALKLVHYGNPHSDTETDDLDLYLDSDADADADADAYSDSDSDSYSDSVHSESDTLWELFVGGSESWEPPRKLPFSPLSVYSLCHFDKTAHWICNDEEVENLIVSFDFESHVFGNIPGPAHVGKDDEKAKLVVRHGNLSIFKIVETEDTIDVWVLKQYGVADSWSKDFVINIGSWVIDVENGLSELVKYSPTLGFKLLMCCNNGEVVMGCYSGYLILYDLSKKSGRFVKHPPLERLSEVMVHTPSLISLRDIVGGGNMEVLNVESRFASQELLYADNYLELTTTFTGVAN